MKKFTGGIKANAIPKKVKITGADANWVNIYFKSITNVSAFGLYF